MRLSLPATDVALSSKISTPPNSDEMLLYVPGEAVIWSDVGAVKLIFEPPLMSIVAPFRSEEHTSELQSLMRISYAVFCLKKKKTISNKSRHTHEIHSMKQKERNSNYNH